MCSKVDAGAFVTFIGNWSTTEPYFQLWESEPWLRLSLSNPLTSFLLLSLQTYVQLATLIRAIPEVNDSLLFGGSMAVRLARTGLEIRRP